jgi:hypothetical protein
MEGLRIIINYIERTREKFKPIFAGAAISGLFVILYDTDRQDYFRTKNIPDTPEAEGY